MESTPEYDERYEYIPEDVLKEVLDAERELVDRRRVRKKPYPTSRDLAEAVVEAVQTFYGHPNEFPDHVIAILESKGFCTRHVTTKRIWSTYEKLVKRGVIGDRLGVLEHHQDDSERD